MAYPHNLIFGSKSLYIKVNNCIKFYHVTNRFSLISLTVSFFDKKPKFWSILQQEKLRNIKTRKICETVAFYLSQSANRTQKFQK